MKRAPRSLQHHVLYRKYNGQDSEISALLGKCGFKSFNDTYGHSRGDTCLKRIAACATAELRETSDVAIRLGGEELAA